MDSKEKIKSVIEDYDDIAVDYANEFYGNHEYEEYIDIFLNALCGKSILDAGCGNGNDCRYISSRGYDIIGIDISKNMLDIARLKLPNIDFMLMNMLDLDFDDGIFDGIIANCSLFHIPKDDLDVVLSEFYRTLKINGKLLIIVAEGIGEKMVDEPYRSGKREVYMNYFVKNQLEDIITKNGFVIDKFILKTTDSDNALGNNEFVVLAEKLS